MSALAALPFSRLRQPRMTLAAFSRTKCREASSPRPMFPPVTMTTFPVQSAVGYGRVVYCDMMNWGTESSKKDMSVKAQLRPGLDGVLAEQFGGQRGELRPARHP